MKDKSKQFRTERLNNQTDEERVVASLLRLLNIKYTREFILEKQDNFKIIDLYVKSFKLAIEIDGNYHFEKEQKAKDLMRERFLFNSKKVKHILRVSNSFVKTISAADLERMIRISIREKYKVTRFGNEYKTNSAELLNTLD